MRVVKAHALIAVSVIIHHACIEAGPSTVSGTRWRDGIGDSPMKDTMHPGISTCHWNLRRPPVGKHLKSLWVRHLGKEVDIDVDTVGILVINLPKETSIYSGNRDLSMHRRRSHWVFRKLFLTFIDVTLVARERVPAAFFVPRARPGPCRSEGAFPLGFIEFI